MRAGPLSHTNIIALLNQYFVPVYVVNEDYSRKGPAPAEEKAELQRIFKEGHAAKKSVGSVHVYILNPDGKLIDSLHVAEAAKPKVLTAMLQKNIDALKLQPTAPVAKVCPQSAPPACDDDSLLLHLVSRSVDGRGAWTDFPVENWIVLTPSDQKALLADPPDHAVLKKILTHFYPATENNDVTKNRFESLSVSTKRLGKRVKLTGTLKMAHSFYHKEDGKAVEADFIAFADFDPATDRIKSFRMTTREARYNGGNFAVAVRSLLP